MVIHEIEPGADGMDVRIYDAPANGWRILYVERDRSIAKFTNRDEALAGVAIYDRSYRKDLFEAEEDVYLEAAQTGNALGECGLSSLVRFGDSEPFIYASFILREDFIKNSNLKIIGFKDQQPLYSPGWELVYESRSQN